MKRVVLVTGHVLSSRRRAGFHWLADAYHRLGWDVTFFTAAISTLTRCRGDYRLDCIPRSDLNRVVSLGERLRSFVWYTPFHPASLRSPLANRITAPLFRGYAHLSLGAGETVLREADLIVFESTPGLVLFDRVRRIAPGARVVYRCSDDPRLQGNHPVVIEAEERAAPHFDLMSFTSDVALDRYRHHQKAAFHPHGLRKDLFDAPHEDPYDRSGNERHAVFVGNTRLDTRFLELASDVPGWRFHLIGDLPPSPIHARIERHGEVAFTGTVPWIQHADAGLFTLEYAPGAEAFAQSSNKLVQYTYCRLPVIAPEFLCRGQAPLIAYDPGSAESVRSALGTAERFDRGVIDRSAVRSWDQLALVLAGDPNR